MPGRWTSKVKVLLLPLTHQETDQSNKMTHQLSHRIVVTPKRAKDVCQATFHQSCSSRSSSYCPWTICWLQDRWPKVCFPPVFFHKIVFAMDHWTRQIVKTAPSYQNGKQSELTTISLKLLEIAELVVESWGLQHLLKLFIGAIHLKRPVSR